MSPQLQSVFKLLQVMRERKLSGMELFKMIDIDGNELLHLNELDEVVTALSDFQKKEIRSIHTYFDIDSNGEIEKSEYLVQLERADKQYDSHL